MLKKNLFLILVLFAASCAWYGSGDLAELCPNVVIPRDTAYVTQKVNFEDEFQIELKGFEGYCYLDTPSQGNYAVITPQFEVFRLRDSDETRVDFNFYTETRKGPPAYIGKRVYSASVTIPLDEKQKEFNGPSVKVKLPPDDRDGFEVILALDVSLEEYRYNQRTFDVKYRYNVQNDPMYMETVVIHKDIPAPKPASSCNSCGI